LFTESTPEKDQIKPAMRQETLSPKEVHAVLANAMPSTNYIEVLETHQDNVTISLPFHKSMLRPGNTISGPAVMAAADTAMYVLVLACVSPEVMAVTANMNINFLNKGLPGDLRANAKILKQGKRLMFSSCDVWDSSGTLVAQITGSYSLP
jgi:uncharacterized protein (TIGR00369 family)